MTDCYCRGQASCPTCGEHTCTDCSCTDTDHWKDDER